MASKLDLLERLEVSSRAQWRAWLRKHHTRTEGVWLISFKKHVPEKHVDYSATVEEALCFGWIDSVPRKLDADRKMLYFCPRRPNSVWSKVNKERIAQLIADGRMAPAGLKKIEAAKRNGSWTALDATEALEMPADLEKALRANAIALRNFEAFPPGSRKQIIGWVLSARTDGTRNRRIAECAEMAAKNLRANTPKQRSSQR